MTHVLIIGGGIVGLATARAVAMRYPQKQVTVVEKEPTLAAHASGRNSGVIHAGLYYAPGSLKATLCVEGARRLKAFCREHDVPLQAHGKLVVATSPRDIHKLEALARNATDNDVHVELLDGPELRKIAPLCTSAIAALWSPDTATTDPRALAAAMARDAQARGVEIICGEAARHIDMAARTVRTDRRTFRFDELINAAGAYADRIAAACGLELPYRMAPFLGRYYQLAPEWKTRVDAHIYPLPPEGLPFLGVHVTKSVDGHVYIGPTATPALGREHYGGLQHLRLLEALPAARVIAGMLLRDTAGMRALARREAMLLWKSRFLAEARQLIPSLSTGDLWRCDKAGIRAQLVDTRSNTLVHDFVVHRAPGAVHILNAVSPGLTSSLAFADYVVSKLDL